MEEAELMNRALTCDPYKVLRRGFNQKVIGYSLYGTKTSYYDKLKNISRQIDELYPGWLMRVYYDGSINKEIICEIECLIDQDELIDNSDFCNVHSLSLTLGDFIRNSSLNANYTHAMKWRWYFEKKFDHFF
jgi:hypothetical protein